MAEISDEIASRTYARWKRGDCLCCGQPLEASSLQPKAIAEGVLLCGICVQQRHDAEDVRPKLLDALVAGRPRG